MSIHLENAGLQASASQPNDRAPQRATSVSSTIRLALGDLATSLSRGMGPEPTHRLRRRLPVLAAIACARAICVLGRTPGRAAGVPLSISIVGNHFVNGAGQTVRLLGVNHASFEYACEGGYVYDPAIVRYRPSLGRSALSSSPGSERLARPPCGEERGRGLTLAWDLLRRQRGTSTPRSYVPAPPSNAYERTLIAGRQRVHGNLHGQQAAYRENIAPCTSVRRRVARDRCPPSSRSVSRGNRACHPVDGQFRSPRSPSLPPVSRSRPGSARRE